MILVISCVISWVNAGETGFNQLSQAVIMRVLDDVWIKIQKSGFNIHWPMQRHGATSFDSFSFDELQYRQNLFPYRLEFGVVGVVLIYPFLRYYLWLTTAGVDEFDIFHYESKVEFNFQRTKRKIRLYFNLFRRNCFKLEEN